MSRAILSHARHNAVAYLALFVALGGTSYAAVSLPANSVGSKQLKKNAVLRAKIKNNAVNGSKVLNNSLTGADINESSLAKVQSAALADKATNATTATSATTATNATHAAASAALDKATYKSATGTAPATTPFYGAATATCDAGEHVVGGGVKVGDPANSVTLDDYPDAGNTAWTAHVGNIGSAPVGFTVYAVCTTISTTG